MYALPYPAALQDCAELEAAATQRSSEIEMLSASAATAHSRSVTVERDFQKRVLESAALVSRLQQQLAAAEARAQAAEQHEAEARCVCVCMCM